jgi:hypothetical protein
MPLNNQYSLPGYIRVVLPEVLAQVIPEFFFVLAGGEHG